MKKRILYVCVFAVSVIYIAIPAQAFSELKYSADLNDKSIESYSVKEYELEKNISEEKVVDDTVNNPEISKSNYSEINKRAKDENLYTLQWRDEYGRKPMTYNEYIKTQPYYTGKNPIYDKSTGEGEQGISGAREEGGEGIIPLVMIFVEDYVYENMNRNILYQYQSDLSDDGYTSILSTWNVNPQLMKNHIVDIYNNPKDVFGFLINDDREYQLVGVVMVGDLPVVWYEFNDDGCLGYNEFPCPLYYMDMDGIWEDTDGNGKYDRHSGNIEPEIWCGWINAKPLFNDRVVELEFLMDYFMRNHEFRQGHIMENKFLVYNDDSFKSFITPYMAYLVNPDNIARVTDYLETTNFDFLQRLAHIPITMEDGSLRPAPEDHYDWVDASIHGSANSLSFDLRFKDSDWLNSWSFDEVAIEPHFIVLRSCGPGRFVEQDYIGGKLLFGPHTNTLVCISSAATHYSFPFDEFYKKLGEGECIGEALKCLFIDTFYNPYIDLRELNDYGLGWPLGSVCHGFVVLGDPTLKPKQYLADNLKGSQQIFEEHIKELQHPHEKPDFFVKNIFYLKEDEGEDYRVGFQWDCIMKDMISIEYPIEEYAGGTWTKFQVRLNSIDKGLLVDSWFDLMHFKYQVLVDGNLEEEGELISFIIRYIGAYNTKTTDVVVSGREPHNIVIRIVDQRNIIDESDENNNSFEEQFPAMRQDGIDLVPIRLFFYDKEGILYSSRIGLQGYCLSGQGLGVSFMNAGRELENGESYKFEIRLRCEEKETEIVQQLSIYKEIPPLPYGWGWPERQVLERLSVNEENVGTRFSFTVDIDFFNNVPEANDDNNTKTVELEVPY